MSRAADRRGTGPVADTVGRRGGILAHAHARRQRAPEIRDELGGRHGMQYARRSTDRRTPRRTAHVPSVGEQATRAVAQRALQELHGVRRDEGAMLSRRRRTETRRAESRVAESIDELCALITRAEFRVPW